MTPRPGRITSTLDIQLARPRARSSEDFLNTRAEILRRLHYGGTVKEPNYYILGEFKIPLYTQSGSEETTL